MDMYHIRIPVILPGGGRVKLQVISTTNPYSVRDKIRNRFLKTGDTPAAFGGSELLHFYPSQPPVDGSAYEQECAQILERVLLSETPPDET